MKKLFLILCAAALALSAAAAVYSSGAGTEGDPLVSKSYVDTQLSQLKAQLQSDISNNSAPAQTTVVSGGEGGFKTVKVPIGKILEGEEGTEIILRSGKGTVFLNGTDGIADTTTGQNLSLGAPVQSNHLLVVPRSDGRGVIVSQDTWFLVKGGYTVR